MLKRLSIRSFTSRIFPVLNGNQESSNQDSASNRSSSSSSIHRPILTPDYENPKYGQKQPAEHLPPAGVERAGDLPPASLPPILPISTNMKATTKNNDKQPDKNLPDKDKKKPEKKEKKKRKCGILLILLLILLILLLLLLIILLVVFGVGACLVRKCHANATCTSQSYWSRCRCNYGFNGNGLECDECGLSYPNLTARIAPPYYSQFMDRDIPPPNSYPATVLIDIRWKGLKPNLTNDSREFYFSIEARCDGLLVNRRTILTAASCVRQYYETYIVVNSYEILDVKFPITIDNTHQHWDSLLTAYVGLNRYFYQNIDVSPARPVVIDDIIIHDGFKDGSLNNNLAIIKLKEPVELDRFVQLACIPDSRESKLTQASYLAFNSSAVSIGWAYYSIDSTASYYLTDFQLNVINTSNCSSFYKSDTDQQQTICAANYEQIKRGPYFYIGINCQGSLGSAMYMNVTSQGKTKALAIGVNINDTTCGLGVYSNLIYFANWIEEHSYY